jgi:hypothetical protein
MTTQKNKHYTKEFKLEALRLANNSENATTQDHAVKAAELSMKAQAIADFA